MTDYVPQRVIDAGWLTSDYFDINSDGYQSCDMCGKHNHDWDWYDGREGILCDECRHLIAEEYKEDGEMDKYEELNY